MYLCAALYSVQQLYYSYKLSYLDKVFLVFFFSHESLSKFKSESEHMKAGYFWHLQMKATTKKSRVAQSPQPTRY